MRLADIWIPVALLGLMIAAYLLGSWSGGDNQSLKSEERVACEEAGGVYLHGFIGASDCAFPNGTLVEITRGVKIENE